MKSFVTFFPKGRRELTTKRNVTVAIAVLGLFAGCSLFFHAAPKIPPRKALGPTQANRPAFGPNPDEVTISAATDAVALPPTTSATYQPPPPTPPDTFVVQAASEISLPSSPSGDYELNLTTEQISAIVEKRYGGIFQSLGLPPAQLARLRSLLVERQQLAVDAANSALLAGVNPVHELPTIHSAIEQAQASIDTMLRSELGESVFAACRESDRTLSERNSASELARLLAAAGDPLRPDQEKYVVQILKNFPGKDVPVDIDRAIFGDINTRARISEQAITEAATMLSPRQLELLRQLAAGVPPR